VDRHAFLRISIKIAAARKEAIIKFDFLELNKSLSQKSRELVKKKYLYYRNMKNIEQYFVNGTKNVDAQDAADPSIVVEQEDQKEVIAMGKRKRVKIRISRNVSKQRTCDIIENKNDLIDKTPSPLNVKANNDKNVSQDETPKSSADLKWRSKKVLDLESNEKYN